MAVAFVFKDTTPPVNSGYMYVAPRHDLTLEPHQLVRVKLAFKVVVIVRVSAGAGIRVGVKARGTVTFKVGCSHRWCIVRISQTTWLDRRESAWLYTH